MQLTVARMSPAIDASENRPLRFAKLGYPLLVSLYRTQTSQSRCMKGLPEVFPVGLAPRQIDRHALSWRDLDVLDPQPAKLFAAECTPEAHEDQRPVTQAASAPGRIFRLVS